MAPSPLRSNALHHSRSLSLPSESNPSVSKFEENLSTLRVSEASCSSLCAMNERLNGLKKVYGNIDDLLFLPYIQHIILKECGEKWVDQALDGYIRLLDAFTSAKDLVSQTKQDVQQLLSALRRKDVSGAHRYLNSRRKLKKIIHKSLRDLRSCLRSKQIIASSEKEQETLDLECMLKDTERVSIAVVESLLSCFIETKVPARQSGWSLVSKLVNSKRVISEGINLNEFGKMEFLLQTSVDDQEELTAHLKEMDSSIQSLEEELECLFRQLIKTRVLSSTFLIINDIENFLIDGRVGGLYFVHRNILVHLPS